MGISIVGFRTTDGMVQPIAWTDRDISKSEAKRLVSKFRHESDFEKHVILPAWRLYRDSRQAQRELPRV